MTSVICFERKNNRLSIIYFTTENTEGTEQKNIKYEDYGDNRANISKIYPIDMIFLFALVLWILTFHFLSFCALRVPRGFLILLVSAKIVQRTSSSQSSWLISFKNLRCYSKLFEILSVWKKTFTSCSFFSIVPRVRCTN